MIFLDLDFENCKGQVVFNGPEEIATQFLPESFTGQRMITRPQIARADAQVADADRLERITRSTGTTNER